MANQAPGTNGHVDAAADPGPSARDAGAAGSARPAGEAGKEAPRRPPKDDATGQRPGDGAAATGGAGFARAGATGAGGDRAGGRSLFGNLTRNRWWRRNLGDNFSLEHEFDAKIDRLRIILSTMPQTVVPAMDPALREQLVRQLDRAAELLDACEPFERVMQRINFVEAEIMMRLADEHLDLALEALRAEASISLPEAASRTMLDEIDKIAGSTEQAPARKVKIVGLKARLTASVIELFRGSERARDAIQILGVALIALTVALGGLFDRNLDLQKALFTHFGEPLAPQQQIEPGPPAGTTAATSPTTSAGALQGTRFADGRSRLIGFAFPVLVMASFFGGIGACLSGLFSFTLQGRVPNEYEGWFRTLIRPVIGLASGFLAVVILRSGLLTFGDDLAWVAITALAFGFSERLFMGTMERLEGLPK